MLNRQRAAEKDEAIAGPWTLPTGWHWQRLGALAKIIAGQSPSSTDCNREGYGLPFFQGKAEFGSLSPTPRIWCPVPARIAEHGDILMSVRAPVGPTNLACERCGIGRGLAAIRAYDDDSEWLLLWLARSKELLQGKATGTTFDAISGDVLRNHPVPVVDSKVRRAIVARVKQMLSEVDDGEAALAQARTDLDRYRRSLLKAAVTGELTADWRAANPPQETGAALLARILADQRSRWQKEARNGTPTLEAPTATLAGSASLPRGWVWVSVGQLFDVFVGSTPSRSDPSLWGGDIPWVSSGEVSFCRIKDTKEKISAKAVSAGSDRLHPPGTVMLGMIGEGKTRGQAAILDITAAHNQNCAAIRVSRTPIPPEYVYTVLEQQYERSRAVSSGGNQPALNKDRVKDIAIPLPPLDECKALVGIVARVRAQATSLADELKCLSADSAVLRQSILAAAFRGDLIP